MTEDSKDNKQHPTPAGNNPVGERTPVEPVTSNDSTATNPAGEETPAEPATPDGGEDSDPVGDETSVESTTGDDGENRDPVGDETPVESTTGDDGEDSDPAGEETPAEPATPDGGEDSDPVGDEAPAEPVTPDSGAATDPADEEAPAEQATADSDKDSDPADEETPAEPATADRGEDSTKEAMLRRGRAAAEHNIDLARQRLSHGAKSLKASAGPLAVRSAEIVKRQGAQSVVKLRDLNKEHTVPALTRFGVWLRGRLHPRSIGRDYKRFLLFIHNRILDSSIDAVFFAPTRGRVSPVSLSIPSQVRGTCHDYKPTPSRLFQWAMSGLPKSFEGKAFVDYGAGRGRVLLMASHYPFEKIRGAEIAAELHDDCMMNVAQYPRSLMKCRDVECERVRATTLAVPDQPTVFYFFDPFDDSVLEEVLARIARSYRRNPREMHLICIGMVEQNIAEAQGIFQPVPLALKQRMKIALFSPYSIEVYKLIS